MSPSSSHAKLDTFIGVTLLIVALTGAAVAYVSTTSNNQNGVETHG